MVNSSMQNRHLKNVSLRFEAQCHAQAWRPCDSRGRPCDVLHGLHTADTTDNKKKHEHGAVTY